MAGTVGSRLNHYQVLGVSPTADSDEITRAFAREGSVLRPHAFGVLAELCIAYETLRDPIKRQAYDASIGLDRKPSLQKLPAGARQALIARGPLAADPVEREAPAMTSQPTFQRRPESLAKPALPLGPGTDSNISPEPRVARAGATSFPLAEEFDVEARPIDWRRASLALGTLVVAACAVGGMAGWWSAGGVGEAARPENTVSVPLPPAERVAVPLEAEIAPAPMPIRPEARSDHPRRDVEAAARIRVTPTAPEPATVEVQPRPDQADPSLGEAAVEATAGATVATAMPLPERVIARTIHRIGYSCGSVASTAPVEGEAPGVYKVTCSSGQAYQARPVNGRYHFKRWGKRW